MTTPQKRARKAAKPQTTRARLQSVIKESRNIMRKDAGLNGELDRLPQLAWLLFLRAFDEVEDERALLDRGYKRAVEGEYRWSEWARGDLTGNHLLDFVNDRLLPYLREMRGSTAAAGDARDTLASIFANIDNRMLSGYLLKELVGQIDTVDFANSDDLHTMAHLYESMLKEMRDAAGDSGEFYTPRPLIRFITEMVDPKVGEVVMDPAMGTGGFLVEAFEHMIAQATTSRQREKVQQSIRGFEKKSMPFLLAQMNFLLHEMQGATAVQTNSLANPVADMRLDGVNVILTNPPFGGEEEKGIQNNFRSDQRTSETVWLFLQAVTARLEKKRGRCGIVVPNSVLFDQGVGARIKAALMNKFNLHTVLRLPNGVFTPYTVIPSNVLFFDYGKQQDHIWFYEQPIPEGRKNYTKTKPLAYEEFSDCANWWGGRERADRVENEHAWKVPVAEIIEGGYNLDLKNPHRGDDLAHRPTGELVAELIDTERELLELLEELQREMAELETPATRGLTRVGDHHNGANLVAVQNGRPTALGEVMTLRRNLVSVQPDATYQVAGLLNRGRGMFRKGSIRGIETKYPHLFRVEGGQVIYSKLFAWEGSVAVVPEEMDGCYVSSEFPTFDVDKDLADIHYVRHILRWSGVCEQLARSTTGFGQRRQRVNIADFESVVVPLPNLSEQRRIATLLDRTTAVARLAEHQSSVAEAALYSSRNEVFNSMR
ncbi:MAG: N-6 DNA methylase [Gordonia amarae]